MNSRRRFLRYLAASPIFPYLDLPAGWFGASQDNMIAAAKDEHQRRLAGRKYQPLLEPDQAPPLDYRDPPRRR